MATEPKEPSITPEEILARALKAKPEPVKGEFKGSVDIKAGNYIEMPGDKDASMRP